jgi:hypothetical protein
MLSLPTDKAKSFGLGPRTFSRKGSAAVGGDRWGDWGTFSESGDQQQLEETSGVIVVQ